MGIWSYYFFAKVGMYLGGFIGLHLWLNLAFALFVTVPAHKKLWRVLKQVCAVPAGIALLYYDSWLPPVQRIFAQAGYMSQFSLRYLMELAERFINPKLVLVIALGALVLWVLSRKLRLSSFALLALLAAPLAMHWMTRSEQSAAVAAAPAADGTVAAAAVQVSAGPASGAELDGALDGFYKSESTKQVSFAQSADPGFDLIFLHVCSLAWDDMAMVKQSQPALFSKFDVVFRRFNSAASYSGPAAIRLLRGNCGQTKHSDLYKTATPECSLFQSLGNVGYEPNWLMNHDGHFGDFLGDVRSNGGLNTAPQSLSGEPVHLRAFDNTPVYDDFALLSHWWARRVAAAAPRVALYYNTVSLHDGNHPPGSNARSSGEESYSRLLTKLFNDFDKFIELLAASGRPAVVVMVPEHGDALRGDKMQISGLREIPSPAITQVPVGIKLVGLKGAAGVTRQIEAPVSFLAVSKFLSNLTAANPFAAAQVNLDDYLRDLPQTEAVSENAGTVILRHGGRYYMKSPDGSWSEYKPG